jgi:hypothetical protein
MTTAALHSVPRPAIEPDLGIKDVLRDTRSLYKRLFLRSLTLGFLVFGALELVRVVMSQTAGVTPGEAALVGVGLSFIGTSLVQGALADSVRDVHLGAEPAGIRASYERAAARLESLVGVSILSTVGITLGFVCLIVPGFIFMTRWAVAVPVVMYEGASPRAALRRSQALVAGHNRAVLTVVLNAAFRVAIAGVLISIAASSAGGLLGFWLGTTFGAALTTPYLAHTLSVLYYRLTEPERPLIPQAGKPWVSVWSVQDEAAENATESLSDEQERKFDEREKQWGS